MTTRNAAIKITAMECPNQGTARENDKSKFDERASQSKRTAGSISIKSTARDYQIRNDSKYHIKYYQIMTAGEGHFQKDCMGVLQLKEMQESITIKRSARENHNQKNCQRTKYLYQGVLKSTTKETRKRLSWMFSSRWIFRPLKILARTNSSPKLEF